MLCLLKWLRLPKALAQQNSANLPNARRFPAPASSVCPPFQAAPLEAPTRPHHTVSLQAEEGAPFVDRADSRIVVFHPPWRRTARRLSPNLGAPGHPPCACSHVHPGIRAECQSVRTVGRGWSRLRLLAQELCRGPLTKAFFRHVT